MRMLVLLEWVALMLAISGCYADPYQNPGDWSMTGAPRKNVAMQVADPSDLLVGKSESASNGVAASAAVDKALGGTAQNAGGLETVPQATTLNVSGSD